MTAGAHDEATRGWLVGAWRYATTADFSDNARHESDFWPPFRRVVLVIAAVAGTISPTLQVLQIRSMPISEDELRLLMIAAPIAFTCCALISPLQWLLVLGIQAASPFSGRTWWPPTPRSNLLDLRNPLPFADLAVRMAYAGAFGYIAGSLATFFWFPPLLSLYLVGLGLPFLGCAAGWQLGVRWSRRAFKHKQPTHEHEG